MKYIFSILVCVYFLCLSVLSLRKCTKLLNEEIQNSLGCFTSYLSVPEGYHLCIVFFVTMIVTFLFDFNNFEKKPFNNRAHNKALCAGHLLKSLRYYIQ